MSRALPGKLRRLEAIGFALFAVFWFQASSAQTVYWTNDSSGDWTTGTNWSTGQPPTAGSDVVIDRGAANPTVTLQGTAQVNSVQSAEPFSIGAF